MICNATPEPVGTICYGLKISLYFF
jgi:hypothetical protein